MAQAASMANRRRAAAALASFALVACAAAPSPHAPDRRPAEAAAHASPRCLTIGAWNDLHGQITPDHPVVDTGHLAVGGVVALADEVSDLRATGDAVVLLDAGDLFTGPLVSTLAEGAPIVDAYRVLGVDAATIGNHEFDFGPVGYAAVTAKAGSTDATGPDGPRGALAQRMETASFPFVAANVRLAGGAMPAWPHFRASTRIARDGFDVGVVGYATRETPKTTLKPNVADLDFVTDAAASVAREIRALRATGAAPVVLLAHASLEGELPQKLDDPADPRGEKHDGEIASLVAALGPDRPDVIVAGHRHAWMLGRVDGVPIVSSDHHGVGMARVRFCREGDRVALSSIERRVVVAAEPPRTELGRRVAQAVAPWLARVATVAQAPVTTLKRACLDQSAQGTAMLEQVARAIAIHAGDAAAPPPGTSVVALTNAGGIRAPLHAGPLRYEDVFATFPFENTVSVCETTRADLTRVIERALAGNAGRTRFPFGIAGAHVSVRRSADGTLALERLVVDAPADAARSPRSPTDASRVWLALPDFVLDGGDGYLEGIPCVSMARSSTRVREAWRELLVREGACDGVAKNVDVRPVP